MRFFPGLIGGILGDFALTISEVRVRPLNEVVAQT